MSTRYLKTSERAHADARTRRTKNAIMTEGEDEDFYVRYYVVRAFFFPPSPGLSLSLSCVLLLSSFLRILCVKARSPFFPSRNYVYIFYAFVSNSLSLSLCVSASLMWLVLSLFFSSLRATRANSGTSSSSLSSNRTGNCGTPTTATIKETSAYERRCAYRKRVSAFFFDCFYIHK
jgi:hypothetical protein